MANGTGEFGQINPWLGALSGALGSLRYAGSQPYAQAGFGNAFGAGMDQAMGFYQMALQGQLMKRKVAAEERRKVTLENIGSMLGGQEQPDLSAIGKALIGSGDPEFATAGIGMLSGQADREWRVAQEADRRKWEEKKLKLELQSRERIAKMGNPLAALGGDSWTEPTFNGPGAMPAPARAPTAPTASAVPPATPPSPLAPSAYAPGRFVGPPTPGQQQFSRPASEWLPQMMQDMAARSRKRYEEWMAPR